LRAGRQQPTRCRAAEERDELAALQLTELHPLPQTWSDRIADWQASSQGLLRCGILTRLLTGLGQNLRLPQRNIGIRFTPVSRHYASEAIRPFGAPFMSLLVSDFVPRVNYQPEH
jgi:hypothetical protein